MPTSLQFITSPGDPSFAGTTLSGQAGANVTVQVLDQNGQALAAARTYRLRLTPQSRRHRPDFGQYGFGGYQRQRPGRVQQPGGGSRHAARQRQPVSLTASASGLTAGQSNTFSVNVPPANLTLTVNPSGAANQVQGQAFTVTAVATDAGNNPIQGYPVTLSLSNGGSANLTNADLPGPRRRLTPQVLQPSTMSSSTTPLPA